MIDQRNLFSAFLYNVTFYRIYLFPTIIVVLFFNLLPFRLKFINIAISGIFGLLSLGIWNLWLNSWNLFSYAFALHLLTYCFILLVIIYIFHEEKKQF